jgi:hypothetical protein
MHFFGCSLISFFYVEGCAAGAAWENKTVLGMIMRIAPSPFDPKMIEMFGEAHRQTRLVVEPNIKSVKNKVKEAQNAVSEIVLATLKSGPVAKVRDVALRSHHLGALLLLLNSKYYFMWMILRQRCLLLINRILIPRSVL